MKVFVLIGFLTTFSFICANPTRKLGYKTFQDKFIERCNYFQKKHKVKSDELKLKEKIDCDGMWKQHIGHIAEKNACETKSYNNLFNHVIEKNVQVIKDKALFWSGTNVIAHQFAVNKNNILTLEDTFSGYIADGLVWADLFEIDKQSDLNSCVFTANGLPYWKKASELFANKAAGTVHVMLNATSQAVNPHSIFGSTEVPVIKKNKSITKVVFILINEEKVEQKESCSKGSVKQLIDDLKKSQKSVDCYDYKERNKLFNEVMTLICKLTPTAYGCSIKG
ncbi:ADP-ribosyl cyclase/cyclic ADP-ribose hydrolase-like [Hydra vulgaris]|uniref:ADP-ribosyl cyclase/cyclic ADP-ribose hydrolase-like n=1 Tax=Hydra vulgaris TaxID=6087 RepID=A0ABM4D778_HYDVU